MKYGVKNIKYAKDGALRIEWANQNMPVLNRIRKRFEKEKPLKGVRLGACLHSRIVCFQSTQYPG
jgi:adenosylhomocysteinase